MNNKLLLSLFIIFLSFSISSNAEIQITDTKTDETIFVFGGDINYKFVQYVADLTGKPNPKILYMPTASADNEKNIAYWESICERIGILPHVLKVWVSSSPTNKSFEETLLDADAIVVGGGNTLNMLGIWKAQGIDTILHKALKQGIILAGGSAGSICWFQNGISDSRPVSLSIVEGLHYLPYSNCPHYDEEARKNLYQQMMMKNEISSGYACDDRAGILFKNGHAVEFVSQSDKYNSYYVSIKEGVVQSEKMKSKYFINKTAIAENDYTSLSIQKKVKDLFTNKERETPLDAFIATTKEIRLQNKEMSEAERNKVLNITIEKLFVYDNKLAGIVNNAYRDFYGLWYFYNNNGVWESLGEDIGGKTIVESEITFREKAKIMVEKATNKLTTQ